MLMAFREIQYIGDHSLTLDNMKLLENYFSKDENAFLESKEQPMAAKEYIDY